MTFVSFGIAGLAPLASYPTNSPEFSKRRGGQSQKKKTQKQKLI
jgi:hypothetical protein